MSPDVGAEEFEELYRATARDVFAFVRRRTPGDADNLVAEVYVVAWRRRADLPEPALRRAWLFGVARTLLKADGRRRLRDRDLVDELAHHTGPRDSEPGTGQTSCVVAAALTRLAPKEREILQLVAWESLTAGEVAVVLGVRPGTARVRLHRARRSLAADPEVLALVQDGVSSSR